MEPNSQPELLFQSVPTTNHVRFCGIVLFYNKTLVSQGGICTDSCTLKNSSCYDCSHTGRWINIVGECFSAWWWEPWHNPSVSHSLEKNKLLLQEFKLNVHTFQKRWYLFHSYPFSSPVFPFKRCGLAVIIQIAEASTLLYWSRLCSAHLSANLLLILHSNTVKSMCIWQRYKYFRWKRWLFNWTANWCCCTGKKQHKLNWKDWYTGFLIFLLSQQIGKSNWTPHPFL